MEAVRYHQMTKELAVAHGGVPARVAVDRPRAEPAAQPDASTTTVLQGRGLPHSRFVASWPERMPMLAKIAEAEGEGFRTGKGN